MKNTEHAGNVITFPPIAQDKAAVEIACFLEQLSLKYGVRYADPVPDRIAELIQRLADLKVSN